MLGITRSLIIIYVILLRMRTHSCIVVGIVKEKRNTVLGRKRLGKDSLAKRTAKTHISDAKGETIANNYTKIVTSFKNSLYVTRFWKMGLIAIYDFIV